MPSASARASRRSTLLYSTALSCFLWPAGTSAQSPPTYRDIPAVVVTSPPPAASKRKPNSARAARATPTRRQRAVAVAAAPVTTNAQATPTLNLRQTTSSGSRLNLTRLQTPASVEVITADTIAERGQHGINDAVIQNATGFTASPAPGNGGLSFNTRGFTGNGTVMTLDIVLLDLTEQIGTFTLALGERPRLFKCV